MRIAKMYRYRHLSRPRLGASMVLGKRAVICAPLFKHRFPTFVVLRPGHQWVADEEGCIIHTGRSIGGHGVGKWFWHGYIRNGWLCNDTEPVEGGP